MKRLCAYILLFLVSANITELDQLLKLPVLFQHYAEHKERDNRVSFVDFLSMHYWGTDLNDQDDDRDMQLPFKKLDVHAPNIFFVPATRVITKGYVQYVAATYLTYRQNFHPDPTLSAPFRPPCV